LTQGSVHTKRREHQVDIRERAVGAETTSLFLGGQVVAALDGR